MNKFKVGDIVLAIADNDEFVGERHGDLFKIREINDFYRHDETLRLTDIFQQCCCYYSYKFKKATKKETEKFKFDYMVNKLKGRVNAI